MKAARLKLSNPHFYLGGITPDDVNELYVNSLNDPELNKYLEARKTFHTRDSVIDFVEANNSSTDSILWGMREVRDDSLCGTTRLHDISSRDGIAFLGIFIFRRDLWGFGLATDIISRVVEHGLSDLSLDRIRAGVSPENFASQCAFSKAGFSVRLRKADGGDYSNSHNDGLLFEFSRLKCVV